MAVTVIALVTIDENEAFALGRYLDVTSPLLERANAKILKRFMMNEALVGQKPAQTVIIVEYPSREAVDFVFESAEYKALEPIRDQAFSSYHISIMELEPG